MNSKVIRRTLCAFLAAASTLSVGNLSSTDKKSVSAADNVIKAEFENGKANGCKIYSETWKGNTAEDGTGEDYDLTNASNGGFSYLDQKGTTVSVEVDVPEEGLYDLTICYCEPSDPVKKVQYLNVNGVNQGELCCPHNNKFEETSAGVVMLKKGKNTIELEAYWGYTYFDYLTVKPADEKIKNLNPTRQLSNPNASESAKRLYNYLCDNYGKHIIAGQQEYCGSHNYNQWNDPDNYIKDNEAEFQYILEQTGKTPAIRGIDLLAYRSNTNWMDDAPERAIQWTNEYKGIVTMTWHWNVPTDETCSNFAFYVESTGNTPYTTFSVSKALEEGTWENEILMADIAEIAKQLTKLKEADVPVLWRPLHEAEGAWFWWGAEGAENCKKLYHLLYDQLTNVYGLDNLIWIWTSSAYPTSYDWYPGNDVVDMIGCDKYNAKDGMPNLSSISSTFYSLAQLTGGQKMVTMSENDTIPSLENLINDKAGWLYFCPWYMTYLTSEQNNPVDNLIEIYNSDYCITLDELPDLKSYPISDEKQPSTTPIASSQPATEAKGKKINGDVNCDKIVDIADCVLIRHYLINSKKYAISEQGLINGDVQEVGNGLNLQDALVIQRYILQISDEI